MTREESVALLERYSNYDGMGIPNLAGCKEAMKVAVDALKEAYPELAESEDEKIRKAIIHYILYETKGAISEATEHTWVKWLEKQKEQKPIKCFDFYDEFHKLYTGPKDILAYVNIFVKKLGHVPIDIHELSACVHYVIKHKEEDTKAKQKSLGLSEMTVHKEPYIAPVPTPMVADERKPIPQEERDDEKSILEDIIVFVSGYADKRVVTKWVSFLKALRPQPKQEWSEDERKILDSIIDDYEAASKSFCGYDGKIWVLKAIRDGEYNLPKPAWSEEDEKMLEGIICVLQKYVTRTLPTRPNSCTYSGNAFYTHQTEIDWLKSLRPSWKPSEEQMAMLLSVINDPNNAGAESCQIALRELYNQLKGLKEGEK